MLQHCCSPSRRGMTLCPEMVHLDPQDLKGRGVHLETQALQGLQDQLVHQQHPLQQPTRPLQQPTRLLQEDPHFQLGHLGLREILDRGDPTDRQVHPGLHLRGVCCPMGPGRDVA